MDDSDDSEDVKSILMFGAQALFEEGNDHSARDIHCKPYRLLSTMLSFMTPPDSEHDIDNFGRTR